MINADEMDNGNSMVTNKGTLSADKIEVGKYGTYKQEGLDALTHVDEVVLNKSSDFVIAGNVNAGNKTLIDESLAFVNGERSPWAAITMKCSSDKTLMKSG